MRTRAVMARSLLVLFLTVLGIGFYLPQKAAAAPESPYFLTVKGYFYDRGRLKLTDVQFSNINNNDKLTDEAKEYSASELNGYLSSQMKGDYLDGNIGDSTLEFVRSKDGCESKVKFQEGHWKLIQLKIKVAGSCFDVLRSSQEPVLPSANLIEGRDPNVVWTDKSHSDNIDGGLQGTAYVGGEGGGGGVWFEQVDADTIRRVDGFGGDFKKSDPVQPTVYFSESKDGFYVKPYSGGGAGVGVSGRPGFSTVQYFENGKAKVIVALRGSAPAGQPAPGEEGFNEFEEPAAPAEGVAGDIKTCEDTGGDLGWIFCPVLRFIDAQLESLDNIVERLLEVPSEDFSTDGPMHKAWGVMRSIAYSILLPIILVMVISTALGFDFISAYAIKKALPRFIIATLFIALSWEITTFLIVLTNNIGAGVQGLLTTPFEGTGVKTSLEGILGTGGLIAVVTAGGIGTGAAFIVLGPALLGILLSYGLVALIALFIGFLVLTLRQVLILALLLVAPLAILAWIFPGNDKMWKLWWGTFSKLLIMYPLIMALITVGRIFAGVSDTTQNGFVDGFFGFLVSLIAYIAPYFFIPATFKFAGGIFATVAGIANDRGRGVFDRQKEKRQQVAGTAVRDFKGGTAGGKYNPRRFASATVGRGLGAGWKGRYGIGKTGAAARANQSNAEPDELAKENINYAHERNDEEVMAAVAMGNNVDKMMELAHFDPGQGGKGRAAAEAAAVRGRAVGNTTRTRVAAAKQLAASGKIIKNSDEARNVIAAAAGSDMGLRTGLHENMKYTWRAVGRNDIGRETIGESLAEMSVSDIGRLKPLGVKGMFENVDAIRHAVSNSQATPEQRDATLGNLYAASESQYLNPVQQANVRTVLGEMETSGDIGAGEAAEIRQRVLRTGRDESRVRDAFEPPPPPPPPGA